MGIFDINQATFPWKEQRSSCANENNNIDLNQITTVYTTTKEESARSAFIGAYNLFENINQYEPIRGTRYEADGTKIWNDETYWQDKPYDDAYDYWNTITDDETKETIKSKFGLLDEEYDALACIALGLASQETGMGFEEGYQNENGKDAAEKKKRDTQINILNALDTSEEGIDPLVVLSKIAGIFGGDIPENAQSASSGLTQMKIHDILNNTDSKTSLLSRSLEELGVTSESVTKNNLSNNPQIAAKATMAYLAYLLKDYDSYKATMNKYHENLATEIEQTAGLNYESALKKGYESVLAIYNDYNSTNSIEEMKKLRDTAKNWVLSSNNSKLEDTQNLSKQELLELAANPDNKYNEEAQLILLNSQLKSMQLDKESLDCIRLFLTEEAMIMSPLEYIPHAWNTGAKAKEDEELHKYDRFLTTQMGIILSNPETFQYDQFTPSVIELAKMYANQGTIDGYYAIEDTLDNYNENARKYPSLYNFEYD